MEATLPTTFGKYELLEKIGTGGMAEIYRARAEGPGGFEKILVLKGLKAADWTGAEKARDAAAAAAAAATEGGKKIKEAMAAKLRGMGA